MLVDLGREAFGIATVAARACERKPPLEVGQEGLAPREKTAEGVGTRLFSEDILVKTPMRFRFPGPGTTAGTASPNCSVGIAPKCVEVASCVGYEGALSPGVLKTLKVR